MRKPKRLYSLDKYRFRAPKDANPIELEYS